MRAWIFVGSASGLSPSSRSPLLPTNLVQAFDAICSRRRDRACIFSVGDIPRRSNTVSDAMQPVVAACHLSNIVASNGPQTLRLAVQFCEDSANVRRIEWELNHRIRPIELPS